MMKLIFRDPAFSFELLRTIGSTYYEAADIGECLSTAYRIKEGDFESWYTEWHRTADRVCKYGDECLSLGHKVSARQAFLRASTYYRTADLIYIINNNQDIVYLSGPNYARSLINFLSSSAFQSW